MIPPARPRLVVSVTASADGRVTLNRASRLLDEAAGKMWDSIHPDSADEMVAARHAEIERRYAPQVVLEGSGTFVADSDGPMTGLPAPSGNIAALYDDFLPAEASCRWFAVVNGRGRIRWTPQGRRRQAAAGHRVARDAGAVPGVSPERGCPLPRRWRGPVDLGAPCAR